MIRLLRDFRRDGGSAAVEFGMVLPVFLVIVVGVLVYGLFFGVVHGVQQLAAEAARASLAGITEDERARIADQTMRATIGNYIFLKAPNAAIRSRLDPEDPARFLVTIRYDATHLGLNAFAAFLPVPPESIERTAVVRRGGY